MNTYAMDTVNIADRRGYVSLYSTYDTYVAKIVVYGDPVIEWEVLPTLDDWYATKQCFEEMAKEL